MRRLPPLTALPAFEATARLGSVTAAAEELGRTHSAISKQIKHLSEDLGGDLFRKSGTGLVLSARGAALQAAQDLELGRLEAPLGFVTVKDGFLAALPRPPSDAVQQFLDWLKTEAEHG